MCPQRDLFLKIYFTLTGVSSVLSSESVTFDLYRCDHFDWVGFFFLIQ